MDRRPRARAATPTIESEVRLYSRFFPAMFARAKGCHVYDDEGKDYLDFFAGAGVLNYGHNPDPIKQRQDRKSVV